ncbi:MAG: hypothetical protein WCP77_06545, partial [Roseococcus sp.]
VRLVGSVFGGSSWPQRNGHMAELLDEGFQRMGIRSVPVMAANAPPRIVAGRDATVGPGPRRAVAVSHSRASQARVQNVSTTRPAAARPATQASRTARPATTNSSQARPAPARPPARSAQTPPPPRPQQVARNGG